MDWEYQPQVSLEQWQTFFLWGRPERPVTVYYTLRSKDSFSLISLSDCWARRPSMGHYITNPNIAFLWGNPSKLPSICCLFDSSQDGSHLMTPALLVSFPTSCISKKDAEDGRGRFAAWTTGKTQQGNHHNRSMMSNKGKKIGEVQKCIIISLSYPLLQIDYRYMHVHVYIYIYKCIYRN